MVLSSYEPHRHAVPPPPHNPADRLSKRNLPRPSLQSLCDRCRHQPIVVVVAVEQQHDIVIIDLRIAEAVRAHVLNGHGERAGSGAQVCELECLRLSRRDDEHAPVRSSRQRAPCCTAVSTNAPRHIASCWHWPPCRWRCPAAPSRTSLK